MEGIGPEQKKKEEVIRKGMKRRTFGLGSERKIVKRKANLV